MSTTRKNVDQTAVLLFAKSASGSLLVLAPSLLAGLYLVETRVPLHAPYAISGATLLLAAVDFIIVFSLEPYRRHLSSLSLPALLGAVAVVLLFTITDTMNRFIDHLGYGFLSPFSAASIALLYAATFIERHMPMKALFCLNSIAVMLLWALGSVDKVSMPF